MSVIGAGGRVCTVGGGLLSLVHLVSMDDVKVGGMVNALIGSYGALADLAVFGRLIVPDPRLVGG